MIKWLLKQFARISYKSSLDAPNVSAIRNGRMEAAIVFIHGFTGVHTSTWGLFPQLVAADGALGQWDIYSVGYSSRLEPDVVGVWSADAPISKLAELFTTTIRFGIPKYRAYCIVAHSMGGLVVQRAILDHPELLKHTSHMFLYGVPSAGLQKAAPFGFAKRQVGDMAFGSSFLSKLRTDWDSAFSSNLPFSFWTIAGERDEFVPAESSLEPFAPKFRAVVPGNHLEIVKPHSAADLNFNVLRNGLLGDAAPAGPWNSARVAIETRRHFEAIQMLEPSIGTLDESGLVMLALAYDGVGRTGDSIRVLEEHGKDKLDAMGTLAGRLKRRWIAERRQQDLDRSLALYSEGLRIAQDREIPDQIYYHAINLAFLRLAINETTKAEDYARLALDAAGSGHNRKWSEATIGEAYLILGDRASSIQHYEQALATGPEPREIESMYRQAAWIAELKLDTSLSTRLTALFRPEGE